MTAVVGILNKEAIALSADSAVTITGSGSRKIFNRANKIFRISHHQPIGVMLYNAASFMGTPWEVILKLYREKLGTNSFPTVKAYQEDFISFLKENQFFTTEQIQSELLTEFCAVFYEFVIREALKEVSPLDRIKLEEHKNDLIELIRNKLNELLAQNDENRVLNDWQDLTFEHFWESAKPSLETAISLVLNNLKDHITKEDRQNFARFLYAKVRSHDFMNRFSGVVFAGFGTDEIFPSLTPLNVSFAWQGRLRYFVEEQGEATISLNSPSAIRSFAQTDVINTILTGVDPQLGKVFLENFGKFFNGYNNIILNLVGNEGPLADQIKGINLHALLHGYFGEIQKVQQENYIKPLMNAVSTLSKEDLAEMAESLIYLTYLKRRITFAEESVGGPVDVALISKGDGFVWIKRKHYFKPELNPHYFSKFARFFNP